ncbi:MAG: hypothetical protein M1282_15835 [Chloroflexi bacterium]|nr:hypothetical protein [Chloroflexota bacterium]
MIRQKHPLLSAPSTTLRASLILAAVLLSACQSKPAPVDPNAAMTQAVGTAFASIQQTKAAAFTPMPADTPTPAPTAARTPPALPSTFVASSLNPLDAPHTYIQDQCQYLKDKWTSTNSAPGTIVMVVMFHGITKDKVIAANAINVNDFDQLMNDIHDMGFQAITTQQLTDFMYNNAKIPERSVLLVVDDRKYASYFNDHFRPYYEKWGWPVVNGWISAFGGQDPVLKENVALSAEGWVDTQAHGVVHNIPMSDSSTDQFITGELQGSITNIQKYFNKTPIAIIWPGGGFGVRPVQFARQFGYKLGFTINPRGPLMFNWVPLADQTDPGHPDRLAEGPVNDPLMVLPRYWDTDASSHLDEVRVIGNQATAYAQQNKATELEYYDIMCKSTLGPIP